MNQAPRYRPVNAIEIESLCAVGKSSNREGGQEEATTSELENLITALDREVLREEVG